MKNEKQDPPAFRPLMDACREHGISRTVAYELVNSGQLETFKIGARRYVVVESLRSLPDRLKAHKAAGGDY
ncbi:hypothetical protein [Lysobacter sp. A3-1-A15]|uniref:hypothetical protein n=1 Tax=Novilysobacter viscosus TaxID=3098602 RepID=UPI002ED87150